MGVKVGETSETEARTFDGGFTVYSWRTRSHGPIRIPSTWQALSEHFSQCRASGDSEEGRVGSPLPSYVSLCCTTVPDKKEARGWLRKINQENITQEMLYPYF